MRMLSKLLNIRANEWPGFLTIYTMAFIFVLGLIWGATIVEAAFLDRVGVEFLPWFFIIKALISVPAVAFYTAFADRIANSKLLIAILFVGAVGVTIGLLLLALGYEELAYPLLFLIRFVPLMEIFAAHWYTYVNGFYDTRAAKRIIPVLETAGIIASVVAGATIPLLTTLISASGIIMLWLLTLLTTALLVYITPAVLRRIQPTSGVIPTEADTTPTQGTRSSYLHNIREGYQYTIQSTFLRWLALATLTLIVLITMLQFRTSQILVETLQTTEAIASFIGMVIVVSNLIVLPIQFFLLSRIIGRIGLGNTTLIYPAGTLAICGGLIVAPGIPTAALALFARNEFFFSFGYPLTTLLYNAVPVRLKGRARAFINGLMIPFGGLVAGLLLITPLPSMVWLLSALLGTLAVAYMALSVVVRNHYSQALINMLEEEDLSSLITQQDTALTVTDPATLQVLTARLYASDDPEFIIFMAQLISQIGGNDAAPILAKLVRTNDNIRIRRAILDILVASDVHSDTTRRLYTDLLSDPDPTVRHAAITGLEHLGSLHDRQFISLALTLVQDPDIQVRVRILSALAQSGALSRFPAAVEALTALLTADEPYQRAAGVRVLGQLHEQQTISSLADYLADPADEVRLQAALELQALADSGLLDEPDRAMLETLRRLTTDPVERVRQAAIAVLGHSDRPEAHTLLVDALSDPGPPVRETAAETLVQMGKAAIPLVHPQLDASEPQQRKMAAFLLTRINRNQFGALLDAYITTGSLLAIYKNHGLLHALSPLEQYAGGALLLNVIRERNRALVDDMFFLFSALHDAASIRVIADSLCSGSSRTRANATEALEALTTPQTASLVAPLLDPTATTASLLAVSQQVWSMPHLDTTAAFQQVQAGKDPWLRTIATYMLGEAVLSTLAGKQATPAASMTPSTAPDALDGMLSGLKARKRERKPLLARHATPLAEEQPGSLLLTLSEMELLLLDALDDPDQDVHRAARSATQAIAGLSPLDTEDEEGIVLSTIERIVFLKEVPFFEGMTVEQLKILATVCEEQRFAPDTRIISQGDPGGTLYVIINGKVGIEQEKRSRYSARVATLGARSYFGEISLFHDIPHTAQAIALEDTFTLKLRREPLIALARQYPELSLELIRVLSQRLNEANARIADLTRARPRELHKLFDHFDEQNKA